MLGRLRRRRVLLAALAAGFAVIPAVFGAATAAAPTGGGDLLPPPEPATGPTPELLPPPPDPVVTREMLLLAQAEQIADLAPEEYRRLVVQAADRYGVDPRLIASVITVETHWRPDVVGSYGEKGLMQILPSTGEYLAAEAGLAEYDLGDPATSIDLGTFYLASLLKQYGSPERALAAYNGGPLAVEEADTHPYVLKVMKVYYPAAGTTSVSFGSLTALAA